MKCINYLGLKEDDFGNFIASFDINGDYRTIDFDTEDVMDLLGLQDGDDIDPEKLDKLIAKDPIKFAIDYELIAFDEALQIKRNQHLTVNEMLDIFNKVPEDKRDQLVIDVLF